MKIRMIQYPADRSGVAIEALTNKGPMRSDIHTRWDIFGGKTAVQPLSMRKFASREEASKALIEGFEVFDHEDSRFYARELIESGWAVEVQN